MPMAESLPHHATVVFLGHHQSGKSTTAGHMVVNLGGHDKRTLERVERETSSRPVSRYSWVLDRQRLERERAMTVNLKLCRVVVPPTHIRTTPSPSAATMSTPTATDPASNTASSSPAAAAAAGSGVTAGPAAVALTLIDTPGHPDYLRNTIAGATQADVAVLLVDSRPAVLQSQLWQAQTRDLALLAANMVNQKALVVAINQLDAAYDAEGPGRGEERYAEAVRAVSELLKPHLKKRVEAITFVPVSGYMGDNLTEPSVARMPWWAGSTLLGAVLSAAAAAGAASASSSSSAAAATDMPLRLPVINIYKVGGIGTVPAGRLAAGRLRRGTPALLLPPGISAHVRSVESFHEPLLGAGGSSAASTAAASAAATGGMAAPSPSTLEAAQGGSGAGGGSSTAAAAGGGGVSAAGPAAVAGDFVGFAIKGVGVSQLRRGCVVSDAGDRPARLAASFTATVQIWRDPTSKREGKARAIRPGFTMVVHVHTAQVACRLEGIVKKLVSKADAADEALACLREGETAVVELRPLRPLVVEPYSQMPHMGKFVVRAAMREAWGAQVMAPVLVAVGRVESVKYVGDEEQSRAAAPNGDSNKADEREGKAAATQEAVEDGRGAGDAGSAVATGEAGERSSSPEEQAGGVETVVIDMT
ncbi:hypothetical protein Agub_g835 [Astrephomene gubernaculifera]|uniref:Tr-type G domain-containing protein n=1 Tax=Astrephomene gubernaculifera TaxID=47775 RepID=A0AAD3DGD4_9CHLO|nr:hypothetical protein Agub_g835 [Astrephomene gubernaculifera]